MPEWVRTNDGYPLKAIDAALDEISRLRLIIRALEDQLRMYEPTPPIRSADPTNV
jgi:hypothetical protein